VFKRVQVPPFDLPLLIRGQGGFEVGVLTLVCKAVKKSELDKALADRGAEVTELLRKLVVGWNDAEEEYSPEALNSLMDEYPGMAQDFLREYTRSMYMVQAKNSETRPATGG
jgi:hypothetical protein